MALAVVIVSGCSHEETESLDGYWYLEQVVTADGVSRPAEGQHVDVVIAGDSVSGGGDCLRFTTSILSHAGRAITLATPTVTTRSCETDAYPLLEQTLITTIEQANHVRHVLDPASEIDHWLLTITSPDAELIFHHAYV